MPENCMLAKTYDGSQDVVGWLMSEKMDGVRAIWTGSKLMSRNNHEFHAPEWFTKDLPKDVVLDGELYCGRGLFQLTTSIVRKKKPIDAEWERITYVVFDVVSSKPYKERMTLVPVGIKRVISVTCTGKEHVNTFYSKLLQVGAEGVMIRNPYTGYEFKRTWNLLKYKPITDDEASVVGLEDGEGKYAGLPGGTLICIWRNKTIRIGSGLNDEQRTNPPKIGSVITFRYRGLTDDGMPRHPTFVEERNYE